MQELHDKTLIPLGLAVSLIGGFGYWLATMDTKLAAHAITIGENRGNISRVSEFIESIDQRLSRIEGILFRQQEERRNDRSEHQRSKK